MNVRAFMTAAAFSVLVSSAAFAQSGDEQGVGFAELLRTNADAVVEDCEINSTGYAIACDMKTLDDGAVVYSFTREFDCTVPGAEGKPYEDCLRRAEILASSLLSEEEAAELLPQVSPLVVVALGGELGVRQNLMMDDVLDIMVK